ncbi:hypothetical protein GOV04_04370 [Candidatus Woesearchaeota archaeon]|nr:hypothetical protein [Candidatus Woesearchaeota archaeon]
MSDQYLDLLESKRRRLDAQVEPVLRIRENSIKTKILSDDELRTHHNNLRMIQENVTGFDDPVYQKLEQLDEMMLSTYSPRKLVGTGLPVHKEIDSLKDQIHHRQMDEKTYNTILNSNLETLFSLLTEKNRTIKTPESHPPTSIRDKLCPNPALL